MLKRANITWTAKQLAKMKQKGTINFDNSVQRGYVWDVDRKSLLIHSMLVGYPIPPLYAAKNENTYDMLDGKQRTSSIGDYLEDSYALGDVPAVELEDGTVADISGKLFSELPEELRDVILSYSLTVYYFDGITEDEVAEMFYRLNNGKAMTAIELTRVKAKSLAAIKALAAHKIFKDALTEKALAKYTNEDMVIKSWAMLYVPEPSFETKELRPMMEAADITEEQQKELTAVFDRIMDIAASLQKEQPKIAKRVLTRTHFISLVPIISRSIAENMRTEDITAFVAQFFSGKRQASISPDYNCHSTTGSAKREAIKKRMAALESSYKCFVPKKDAQEADCEGEQVIAANIDMAD